MGREVEIETEVCLFDKKMETPQRALICKDWKAFKKFFVEEGYRALMDPFDLAQNTAIHIATRSNNPLLLTELLEMLPAADRWRALSKRNANQSTLLHEAILCTNVEVVDVILKYEKELPTPPDEKIDESKEKHRPLVELKNSIGETPLYRAAKRGKLKMLKHLSQQVTDLHKHFERDVDGSSILHAAVISQRFDTAIWLLKVDESLADRKDENRQNCLQLLSKMPFVFRSHSHLGTIKMLMIIYSFLPEQCYLYDDHNRKGFQFQQTTDIESGEDVAKPPTSVVSRINYVFWKSLTREWDGIKNIWQTKKQHKLVEALAEMLVRRDSSWHRTFNAKQRSVVFLPEIQPTSYKAARKNQMEVNQNHRQDSSVEQNQSTEQTSRSTITTVYTPLLMAASTGIVEIVEKIIDIYPDAINHVSGDEQNILHMAVKHRRMEIYRIIKKHEAMTRLSMQITNKGRTVLHQVARMEYYRDGKEAGVAFQLQDDLRWFERVKKIIPPNFFMHCNEDNLTARQLFEIEHAEMLKEAQDWIKETAQSCSAVAVLVATVFFAAAYTVPGGTDTRGLPVFLTSPVFLFFTIMDVVSLASSLASVVMFLSILTSPFEMQEFYKALPQKLTLGFSLLFFSLTTTMLAFSATILLTIRLESNKWSSSLIYSAAFFPVTIFGLLQFPFYMAVKTRLKQALKKLWKLVPSPLKKSIKKRK